MEVDPIQSLHWKELALLRHGPILLTSYLYSCEKIRITLNQSMQEFLPFSNGGIIISL